MHSGVPCFAAAIKLFSLPSEYLAYTFNNGLAVRGGWGKFYQSQEIFQLNVRDGDDVFYPAELAEHRILSIEQKFRNNIRFRIEGYQKDLSNVRPRYQNLDVKTKFDDFFPELNSDRVRIAPESGRSKGVEFSVSQDKESKYSWWASYSLAETTEKIDGQSVSREFDQRHTVYLDLNIVPSSRWRFNFSWQYHSGLPYTSKTLERVLTENENIWIIERYGALNKLLLPSYHRMDIRINRYFQLPEGRLSTFLEVRNLYNRNNVRAFDYAHSFMANDPANTFISDRLPWLPVLPSFGLSWEF